MRLPDRRRAFGRAPLGALGAVVALLAPGAPARAQILDQMTPPAADTTPPAAPAPAPPAAIPAADIVVRSDRTGEALRQLEATVARDPRVVQVERELTLLTARLDPIRELTALAAGGGHSFAELEDLALQWQDVTRTIDGWLFVLQRRAEALVADRDSVGRLRRVWELTAEAARRDRLPQPVQARIETMRGETGRVEAALRDRLDAVLTVQSRVAAVRAAALDGAATIRQARADVGRQLLLPTRPPLWQEVRASADTVGMVERLARLWDARSIAATSYLRARRGAVIGLAVGFVVVLLSLRDYRRRLTPADRSEVPNLASLLARPVSAGVIVALVFTPLALPFAPTLVAGTVTLVALVPLARLVPGTTPPELRRGMYGVLGVSFLSLLARLGQGHPLAERLAGLAVAVVAAVGLVLLLRRWRRQEAAGQRSRRPVIGALGRFAVLLLGAGAGATALGFVPLGLLLTDATILSAFAAVGFYVGARAAEGFAWAFIRWGLGRLSAAVRNSQESLCRRASAVLRAAAMVGWVWVSLTGFLLAQPVWAGLRRVLTARLTLGSLDLSLADVLAFGVAIWLAVLVSRAIRYALEDDVLPRLAVPTGVASTVSTLVYYAALLVGFVFAIGAAGFDLTRFAILAGAFGVGLGFGLQNVVNNFVSGLILKFERPMTPGDVIEFDTVLGTVKRIGVRSSTIRTFAGADVIVPNGDLVAGQVVNWTLSDRKRRIEIAVGVAYGTPPGKVLGLLVETARQNSRVLGEPEPTALFEAFGDSSLNFKLRCWTEEVDTWKLVASELTTAIHDALKEAGIEIPFPQRDLHLRSISPGARRALRDPPDA